MVLSKSQRDKLILLMKDKRMSTMFGDGLEEEYILNGCDMVGLNQMTDKELVEEYEEHVDCDDDFLVEITAEK